MTAKEILDTLTDRQLIALSNYVELSTYIKPERFIEYNRGATNTLTYPIEKQTELIDKLKEDWVAYWNALEIPKESGDIGIKVIKDKVTPVDRDYLYHVINYLAFSEDELEDISEEEFLQSISKYDVLPVNVWKL